MKPSETICPASVAMMDELWPDAKSASAKSTAAPVRRNNIHESTGARQHGVYATNGEKRRTLAHGPHEQVVCVKKARRVRVPIVAVEEDRARYDEDPTKEARQPIH